MAFLRVLRRLPPIAFLAAAWLFLIIYAFPGQVTQDSLDHLTEIRRGVYTDAHPPVINLLWRCLDYAVTGPFLVLVAQSTLFLGGLYLVLRRLLPPRRAAVVASAVFLFPPVFLPFAVIWKDCLMAGGLVMGAALLGSERRSHRMLALLALLLATAVRYNAFAATFALIVLLFEWRTGLRWWKRYPIALAAWIGVTAGAFAANEVLTDQPMYYWQSSIAVHDIVGTIVKSDEAFGDAQLEELLAGTELQVHENILARMRDAYTPTQFVGLIANPTKQLWQLPTGGFVPPPAAQREAISRAWKRVVTTYPLAYLEHRLAVTAAVLELGTNRRAVGVVPPRELRYPKVAQDLGLSIGTSPTQQALTSAARWITRHLPIFAPWMYGVLALVLLVLGRRQRDVLALLLSGLGLESSLVFVAPSDDYRYSHWMVVTVVIAAIFVGVRRRRAAPPAAEMR